MVKCKNCGGEMKYGSAHAKGCPTETSRVVPTAGFVEAPETKEIEGYRIDKWQELPPPVVEWLKINFGNWLNHFEVGRTEYKKDFGGYGVYIKIPEQYSTEWFHEQREQYDNKTRRPAVDEQGNPIRFDFVTKDIRVCSLQMEMPKVIQWLERVKEHVITHAHAKGIKLPSIGEEVASTKSLEDYKKSLYK
jgi:hypothetical protein